MLENGFHDIPAGKLAMIVTHLEMTARPEPRAGALPDGVSFHQVQPDLAWYRDIFHRVGSREWLWFSRLGMADAELQQILDDPMVAIFTLRKDGKDEALLELDFRVPGECELAYFGLTRALIGSGAGRYLMAQATRLAWEKPIDRFHVHTCTIDSPVALDFYRRSGFVAVRQQVEIADDPRLCGDLPADAGPHVPIISARQAH
jgi:GNAT superfamily N-acetyltransferase